MAENSKKKTLSAEEARQQLASNWAQMTASMVSPDSSGGPGNGPAPLPVSALPMPDDEPEPEDDQPKHLDLPRNASGELTPAQRARLGLDLEPTSDKPTAQSAASAPSQAPPAEQPLPPPSQPEAPRAQPQAAAAPPPPVAPPKQPVPARRTAPATPAPPPPEPPPEPVPAQQQQPGTSFDFKAMEQPGGPGLDASDAPQFVSDEPKLTPVSKQEPKLAPARQKTAPSERAAVRRDNPAEQPKRRPAPQRREREDGFEHVERDRNVLTYGVAWTAFAIVVTGAIAFTGSMSGDPTASAGPGPLIPGLLSIALGWIIVIAARAMGKGWWGLMIVPAIVLLIGPYVYKNVWAGSVEDAARSYLSTNGSQILIDVDATSVISATENTDRGCFAINRTRSNYDTEVAVVSYTAETARQQADYALAPRYAARIEAGGDRSTYRVFTFKGGRAPAIVSTPATAPLDCENSVSAPGSGAKREGAND